MDNIRQTLKILFHDRDIDSVVKQVDRSINNLSEALQIKEDEFCLLYVENNFGLTLDNAGMVLRHFNEEWIKGVKDSDSQLQFSSEPSVFNLLLHFVKDVLAESGDEPVCKYESLLRWNETTSFLGEDIFTTAFLAGRDLRCGAKRDYFCWPSVIGHNNSEMNYILSKPLIDMHFHLKGSSLNFDLNWMSLMNHVVGRRKDLAGLKCNGEEAYNKIILAACIRYCLCEYVAEENNGNFQPVYKLFKCHSLAEALPYAQEFDRKIQSFRSIYGRDFNFPEGKKKPDYAIMGLNSSSCPKKRQPCIILAGERWLLYSVFRKIFSNEKITPELQPLLYVYLLIKSWFRTQFIQSGSISGFRNFSEYERRKECFTDKYPIYSDLVAHLAAREFIQDSRSRRLEARITPKNNVADLLKSVRHIDTVINKDILEDREVRDLKSQYAYVMHFIKTKDTQKKFKSCDVVDCRHAELRNTVRKQAVAIHRYHAQYDHQTASRVVGIDAANSEILARPEVFAQAFRYLHLSRVSYPLGKSLGMTYHAGEDFVDIMDGLRAIDEVLQYMNFDSGDRIGHGLVLGVDVRTYYAARHNNVIMPYVIALDNIVWAYINGRKLASFPKVQSDLEQLYESYLRRLYPDFSGKASIFDYYQAWLLRGDNPGCYKDSAHLGSNHQQVGWSEYSLNMSKEAVEARNNVVAKSLFQQYHYNAYTRMEGDKTFIVSYSDDMVDFIGELQEMMVDRIESNKIVIETNPTSNLLIGNFELYEDLPIMRIHNLGMPFDKNMPEHDIAVSINTDDKGIFGTSLEREYSLMALALEKHDKVSSESKLKPRQIYEWIDGIREDSLSQTFCNN